MYLQWTRVYRNSECEKWSTGVLVKVEDKIAVFGNLVIVDAKGDKFLNL